MIGTTLIVCIISAAFGIVSAHHWVQFAKRRHPLSLSAALMPLCGVLAALESFSVPRWERAVTLTFCLVASVGTATAVVLTRRAERKLRELREEPDDA